MNRRDFMIGLGVATGLAPAALAAEKPAKIGILSWGRTGGLELFYEAMQQNGYSQAKDYEIEAYFTDGNRELTENYAKKLVEEPVDILVAWSTPAVQIAKEATQTIPIVMVSANALATGPVGGHSNPGGNITGVSLLLTDLAGKRLELLREIRPSLQTVGFLGSAKAPNAVTFVHETEGAAERLGIRLLARLVDGPEAIDETVFTTMKQDGAEAVIVQPVFTGHQDKIVPMAMKAGLPVVADWAAFAEAGALFTYGPSGNALVRRTAYFVDRILKGAKPADLPVEQPTEFDLVVNARTASGLGWMVPDGMRLRASRVIE